MSIPVLTPIPIIILVLILIRIVLTRHVKQLSSYKHFSLETHFFRNFFEVSRRREKSTFRNSPFLHFFFLLKVARTLLAGTKTSWN